VLIGNWRERTFQSGLWASFGISMHISIFMQAPSFYILHYSSSIPSLSRLRWWIYESQSFNNCLSSIRVFSACILWRSPWLLLLRVFASYLWNTRFLSINTIAKTKAVPPFCDADIQCSFLDPVYIRLEELHWLTINPTSLLSIGEWYHSNQSNSAKIDNIVICIVSIHQEYYELLTFLRLYRIPNSSFRTSWWKGWWWWMIVRVMASELRFIGWNGLVSDVLNLNL